MDSKEKSFKNDIFDSSAVEKDLKTLILNNDLYNFNRIMLKLRTVYFLYYCDKESLSETELNNSRNISKMIYDIGAYLINNEHWDFVVSVLDLSIVLKGNSHFDNNNTDLIDGDISKVILEYLLIIDERINKKQDRFIGGYIGHYIVKYYRAKTVQNYIEIIDDYILNNNNPLNKRYAIENLNSKLSKIKEDIDEDSKSFSIIDAEQSLRSKVQKKSTGGKGFVI